MRGIVQVIKKSLLVALPALVLECCEANGKAVDDGRASGTGGSGGNVPARPVVISTTARTPRSATWSINYWTWSPTFGDAVTGTDSSIAPLRPAIMRVGGYNNDANTPDPFDAAALDHAVAYARAIGAEPLIQTPLLADTDGAAPTAASAAAMVSYANVTKGYGVKYFSIGNEPDIYAMGGVQGESSVPEIPGYTPEDYCATARAYVTQMRAVDPSIQIVGPDLAYRYTIQSDWLTPVLTGCGDLFDIVSIHRYPFSSSQASLANAAGDAVTFRDVVTSVRGLMQTAGYGDKPLAITEMNIAYDSTAPDNTLPAVPGTVPAALWLADILGSAMNLNLWTAAVWAVSDVDAWSMGLLGLPPAHTPRPAYYAYALYAEHFGPTMLDVTSEPAGVRSYATRNQADDGTQIIVVNWNTSSSVLSFEVTGLPKTPAAPVFALPPLSVAAVEIPDSGTATAWTYGEAQHKAGSGPEMLAQGSQFVDPTGSGLAGSGGEGGSGESMGCSGVVLGSPDITTHGHGSGTATSFGTGDDRWDAYSFAAPSQGLPTVAATADGNGLEIAADFVPASSDSESYSGVGLYYYSTSCVDGSAFTGIQFDVSGDLGGCLLTVGVEASEDVGVSDDMVRGRCHATSCYGPSAAVLQKGTIQVPFANLSGGTPVGKLDKASIIGVQWQLTVPLDVAGAGGAGSMGGAPGSSGARGTGGSSGGAEGISSGGGAASVGGSGGRCAADLTVANVSFY